MHQGICQCFAVEYVGSCVCQFGCLAKAYSSAGGKLLFS